MMKTTPILGGAYQSRSLLLNAQRCVNLYPELVETKDGKEVGALYSTPGLRTVYANAAGPWRALREMGNGALFGVRGNLFEQITRTFGVIDLGTLGSGNGPAHIADNGSQLLIVDGRNAYGYDIPTNKFQAISLPFDSGGPIVCAYQDGFFILNQTGTTSWWQSNINDVFTWNGLNFSSKDGAPDPIVTVLDHHREVWLFGSQTTEVWVNQGNPGFTFGRLEGVFFEYGCAAPHSACCAEDRVLWLSRSAQGSGVVLQARGYQVSRVSTHAIERAIQGYDYIGDATSYTYQQEGHVFYVLTFPSADATWVLDVLNVLWHERAGFDNGHFHRHRSNCAASFNGQTIVGDFQNGNLYLLDLDAYDDDGAVKKWLRSWPAQGPGQITLRNDRYASLQVYMETAVGVSAVEQIRALDNLTYGRFLNDQNHVRVLSGPPPVAHEGDVDPRVMLRWSDTGGRSFGNEHWRSAGKIGEIKRRVKWDMLGSSRDRVFELSGTDPMRVALLGAMVDMEPGLS